ncbi:MAG: hypothetical protein LBS71_03200 [Puniceicoccales bacterium]|jgi:hypothetical protein|nr:hypothetical protein [Puniceicoccales bacterium]
MDNKQLFNRRKAPWIGITFSFLFSKLNATDNMPSYGNVSQKHKFQVQQNFESQQANGAQKQNNAIGESISNLPNSNVEKHDTPAAPKQTQPWTWKKVLPEKVKNLFDWFWNGKKDSNPPISTTPQQFMQNSDTNGHNVPDEYVTHLPEQNAENIPNQLSSQSTAHGVPKQIQHLDDLSIPPQPIARKPDVKKYDVIDESAVDFPGFTKNMPNLIHIPTVQPGMPIYKEKELGRGAYGVVSAGSTYDGQEVVIKEGLSDQGQKDMQKELANSNAFTVAIAQQLQQDNPEYGLLVGMGALVPVLGTT